MKLTFEIFMKILTLAFVRQATLSLRFCWPVTDLEREFYKALMAWSLIIFVDNVASTHLLVPYIADVGSNKDSNLKNSPKSNELEGHRHLIEIKSVNFNENFFPLCIISEALSTLVTPTYSSKTPIKATAQFFI